MRIKRYKMSRFRWKIEMGLPLLIISIFVQLGSAEFATVDNNGFHYSENYINRSTITEFASTVIEGKVYMEKALSPYLVRNDITIRASGELIIEPGVEVRFTPMTGITVYGVLTAKGYSEEKITLTTIEEPDTTFLKSSRSYVRLVDGPNILTGRLQIWYNEQWRSICTNSRNWTKMDLDTVCHQLGFKGGSWWNWVDKEAGISRPRLLLEQPNCVGDEQTLFNCKSWHKKQLGSGVCDYHPDIGIQCSDRHESSKSITQYWRGIHFHGSLSDRILSQQNTLYIRSSLSHLSNTEIKFAGLGHDYAAVSAIDIQGVPPHMKDVRILYSAYNGINITDPGTPFILRNTSVIGSKGYGIHINSTTGHVLLENCIVEQNGADGIKYVHHDSSIIERSNLFDFCTFPTTASQTFPITISFEQNILSYKKDCNKHFFTHAGQVLTVHFQLIKTSQNSTSYIEIFDGTFSTDMLLAKINIENNTKPQAVTTTGSNLYMKFSAEVNTDILIIARITSSFGHWYDLNLTDCTIRENNGRGIAVEQIRSQLYIKRSVIANNKHIAGVHVFRGASYVNITKAEISFNEGAAVNISHSGGSRNISNSYIYSNRGYGIAVWLNETKDDIHQTALRQQHTVIAYNEISGNLEEGILVGNFCTSNSHVNISGNHFNGSLNSCIEIGSCLRANSGLLRLHIGNNVFIQNRKLAIKLSPLVNSETVIEYNYFSRHVYGTVLIKNGIDEDLVRLPSKAVIRNNEFLDNSGVYVLNIGLSPYSEIHRLLFTWNFVRNNRIKEPFETSTAIGGRTLIPRNRVAAVIAISSENVHIFRNIIQNHESKYELGSHLEDQSKTINCTYNWLGYSVEEKIFPRIFHRKDRYNLAKIEFLPFLLHNSNPGATTIMEFRRFVPEFYNSLTRTVGGEVDGLETLRSGEYLVEQDISVRPGGRLSLEPGVTLRFPPSIGLMVAGKLDARGRGPNDIKFTLSESVIDLFETNATADEMLENFVPVRLFGGRTQYEGRLQVNIDGKWGTVCNYGWTVQDASLVCHQLGFILNPYDWFLDHSEIPQAGSSDPILLSNVKCTEEDVDITSCRAERIPNFENVCTHNEDVGMRCYEPKWAGIRFGVLAERSHLQFITIEHAGLLDYTTDQLKPALQIDFNRHSLESIKVINNINDALGIIYSDLYSAGINNNLAKNCDFINNRGTGVSIKQLGLKLIGCNIMDNKVSGVSHDPVISMKQQKEIIGWFKYVPVTDVQYISYRPIFIPNGIQSEIEVENGDTKYLITERIIGTQSINRTYFIKTKQGYSIGIQLLNPVQNYSTEQITIINGPLSTLNVQKWDLRRDLSIFPVVSRSTGIILEYRSGTNAVGNVILVITSVPGYYDYSVPSINNEFIPTLSIFHTRIKRNRRGMSFSYYNRYLTDSGDHYLRKNNETILIINSDVSYNEEEAVYMESPYWDFITTNISEITVLINNTLVTDNGRGIYQFCRDLTNSNNLYHWILNDNSLERNVFGSFEVSLPYVWQYNENFTHSLLLHNNTWADNKQFALVVDGHYAKLNITYNTFRNNICKNGLITVQGMEKSMHIKRNLIEYNTGDYIIKFETDSQSEIQGELHSLFDKNIVKKNKEMNSQEVRSSLIMFDGLQRVRIKRNLLSDNKFAYALFAGVKTARIDSKIDVSENWWGTTDSADIRRAIFDFDDWNDHSLAIFKPYLMQDDIEATMSSTRDQFVASTADSIEGRLLTSMTLYRRDQPYSIRSDLTIMPEVTLTIEPGTILEFAPRVGILVLGKLIANGEFENPIIMRPMKFQSNIKVKPTPNRVRTLRLCTGSNCTENANSEGFLEYWNATTLQWVPICDSRFTEHNAEVVCRELGLGTMNVWISRDRRYEFLPNALMRIWSWPEPVQCKGNEETLDECQIRLNGQLHGKKYSCSWDSLFVFIHCGDSRQNFDHWGGVRFANSEFESNSFEDRIHDSITHETIKRSESILQHVHIIGAGLLHSHKSPAILSVKKSPQISHVNITGCASDGISYLSPEHEIKLMSSRIVDNAGIGVVVNLLTGEGRESMESSFTPVQKIQLPYNVFSLLDICDPVKEIVIQEKVVLYYKYTNNPVTCIKIFHSALHFKPFGFRFLQFNLLDKMDRLYLYDGSIYNTSSKLIKTITSDSGHEKHFIKTENSIFSIKMVVSGATEYHGFMAEIVTLPISVIGFNRDVQHNISYSVFTNNWKGAVYYISAGEVNPRLTIEWNQFINNCYKMYGNFTSCDSALMLDLQNTQNLYFRNNLIMNNEGGVWLRADSKGSATSLKSWIHNNLFTGNKDRSTLHIEGRQTSPYQEVVIYRNYWTKNESPYANNIKLNQVVSNFTYNYIHNNIGSHTLEISGFDGVRLPIYQTTTHNGFYWNYADEPTLKGTIVAGTAGQHYVDNILFNPDNDYEIITVNHSAIDVWKTPIDARHNYWGYNESLAVSGRIRDYNDNYNLLEVDFRPFHVTNGTILDGKCPPGWNLVGDTCYIYLGVPMSFYDAKDFCRAANSSMPFVMGNLAEIYKFLTIQQESFNYYERVWVQHIDMIGKCPVYTAETIEEGDCRRLHPFLCEMDPKVVINAFSWRSDILTLSALSSLLVCLLLLAIIIFFWCSKSKHRQMERLERRNSIRQSLNSLRSLSSSQGGFNDLGFKRKALSSQQASPSLNRAVPEYKKMNGSIDSMDKSQFNSSLDDESPTYDLYEVSSAAVNGTINKFDLSYQNKGYRDNSTFASGNNSTWQSSDYVNNSSTLPLTASLGATTSTNTLTSKRDDYQQENEYHEYYERPKSSTILETNLDEPGLPPIPPRSKSEILLETNFDYNFPGTKIRYNPAGLEQHSPFLPTTRSKSEPLETAM